MILKIIFKPLYFLKSIWDNVSSYFRLQFYRNSGIKIGEKVFISPKAFIDRSKPNMITIGDNCMITRDCMILCHSDAKQGGLMKLWGKREYGKVKIGKNVFLGVNTVVMPGVTIGDNVIIGAMSLVDKDIPSNCLAYGIPVKKVKNLNRVFKK